MCREQKHQIISVRDPSHDTKYIFRIQQPTLFYTTSAKPQVQGPVHRFYLELGGLVMEQPWYYRIRACWCNPGHYFAISVGLIVEAWLRCSASRQPHVTQAPTNDARMLDFFDKTDWLQGSIIPDRSKCLTGIY